ncbi:hypothetical protein BH09ACT10_BH09ACT10_30880 [soil metagenome]
MRELLTCDLLVIGGGMAGMTAAQAAAEEGATVVVVEKAPAVGGSAAISGGFVWTADDVSALAAQCPRGDHDLVETLVEGYPRLMRWLARSGVTLEAEQRVMFGRGRRLDIFGYLQRAHKLVQARGGMVATSSTVDALEMQDGVVCGATVRDHSGILDIRAGHTVLATGGFQGNRGLLERHMGPMAARLLHRSNPYSTGDGLQLGLTVGGATSVGMDTFYGHLIAGPVPEFTRAQFVQFAAFVSEHGLLVNLEGARFADESLGDHKNAQEVARQSQGRAVLFIDEPTRANAARRSFVAGLEAFDVVEEARGAGGRVASAANPDELLPVIASWGYETAGMASVLAGWRARREEDRGAPFYALEVRPGITFTEGGLRIDRRSRVLDANGHPVPRLLAAGADTGGTFAGGYGGGLALAGVFGLVAAEEAGF